MFTRPGNLGLPSTIWWRKRAWRWSSWLTASRPWRRPTRFASSSSGGMWSGRAWTRKRWTAWMVAVWKPTHVAGILTCMTGWFCDFVRVHVVKYGICSMEHWYGKQHCFYWFTENDQTPWWWEIWWLWKAVILGRLGSQVGPQADGRVVEEGSHDDLLLADGHYRRLLEHQLPGSFSGALYPRAGRLAIDSYSMFGLCYFVSSTVFVYIYVACVEWFDHRFKSHI